MAVMPCHAGAQLVVDLHLLPAVDELNAAVLDGRHLGRQDGDIFRMLVRRQQAFHRRRLDVPEITGGIDVQGVDVIGQPGRQRAAAALRPGRQHAHGQGGRRAEKPTL